MDWNESVDLTSDFAELDEEYIDDNTDSFQLLDCIEPNTDPSTDPLEVPNSSNLPEVGQNDSGTHSSSSRIKIHNNIIISPPVINKTNNDMVDLTDESSVMKKSPAKSVIKKTSVETPRDENLEYLIFPQCSKSSAQFSPTKPPKQPPLKIFESPPDRSVKHTSSPKTTVIDHQNMPNPKSQFSRKQVQEPVSNISNIINQTEHVNEPGRVKIVLPADVLAKLTNSQDSIFLNIPGMGHVQLTDDTKKMIEAIGTEWAKKRQNMQIPSLSTEVPFSPAHGIPVIVNNPDKTNVSTKVAPVNNAPKHKVTNQRKSIKSNITNVFTTTQIKSDLPVIPLISDVKTLAPGTFDISQIGDDNPQIVVVHDDDDIIIVENDETSDGIVPRGHKIIDNTGEIQRKMMLARNEIAAKTLQNTSKTCKVVSNLEREEAMEKTKSKTEVHMLQKKVKRNKQNMDDLGVNVKARHLETLVPPWHKNIPCDNSSRNKSGRNIQFKQTSTINDSAKCSSQGLTNIKKTQESPFSSNHHLEPCKPQVNMNFATQNEVRRDSQENLTLKKLLIPELSPPVKVIPDGSQGRISVRNFKELVPSQNNCTVRVGSEIQPQLKINTSVFPEGNHIMYIDSKGNANMRTIQSLVLPAKDVIQRNSQVDTTGIHFLSTVGQGNSELYINMQNIEKGAVPINNCLTQKILPVTDKKDIQPSKFQQNNLQISIPSSNEYSFRQTKNIENRGRKMQKKRLMKRQLIRNKIPCLLDIKYCWKLSLSTKREDFCCGFTYADRVRISRCIRKLHTRIVLEEWQYRTAVTLKKKIDELRAEERSWMLANIKLVEIGNITKNMISSKSVTSSYESESVLVTETKHILDLTTNVSKKIENVPEPQDDLLLLTKKVTFNPENPRGRRRKHKFSDNSAVHLRPSKLKKLIHGYKQNIAMSKKLKETKMSGITGGALQQTHDSCRRDDKTTSFGIIPCYVELTKLEDLPKSLTEQYMKKNSRVSQIFKEKVIRSPQEFHKRISNEKPFLILNYRHLSKLMSYTNYEKYNLLFPVDVKKPFPSVMYHSKALKSEVEIEHILLVDQSVLSMYLQGGMSKNKK